MAMNLLEHRTILIRERVLAFCDTYDVFDATTATPIGQAHEVMTATRSFLRCFLSGRLVPVTIQLRDAANQALVFSIDRGVTLLRSDFLVRDGGGIEIGRLKSKFFGAGFQVFDPAGKTIANVQGDWKGWDYKFVSPDGSEIGRITKRWGGIAKELLTTADSYVVAIHERASRATGVVPLLLATALAIDVAIIEHD